MNRRDTLKAVVGVAMGLLGVKVAKAVPSVPRYRKWLIVSTYTASEFNLKGAIDWVTAPGPFERSFEVNRMGSRWEITELELRAEPLEVPA